MMTKQVKTFFAKPGDPAHLDALEGYFRHASENSNVYVSLSRGSGVYDKIKRHCKASVHDNYFWEQNPNAARIHNKFFAFERLDYGQWWLKNDVVVVTTGNINANTRNKHESMVRFQSRKLFSAFKKRWGEIENHRSLGYAAPGWTERSEGYDQSDPELKVKVYFFPRKDGRDTFVDILDNIDKAQSGRVRLLVPRFRRTRRHVADRLRQIADAGKVKVEVITRPRDGGVDFDLRGTLGRNVKYKVCKSAGRYYFHSRYLTVDAIYLNKRQKLTWMGTPNLSKPALDEAYETLLKIWDRDNEVYEACSANFADLWNNYARFPNKTGHWPN